MRNQIGRWSLVFGQTNDQGHPVHKKARICGLF